MSTEQLGTLIESVEGLIATVNTKLAEADTRVGDVEENVEAWKGEAPYYQNYSVAAMGEGSFSGHYNLVKILTITDTHTALNSWINLAWTGSDVVGNGVFLPLFQMYSSYTGNSAIFSKFGNGDVRFFLDKTDSIHADVFVAIKNPVTNSASVRIGIGSSKSLDVEGKGNVDIDSWLAANAAVVEIDLITITA